MLSSQRFAKLNRRQQFKEMSEVANRALVKLQKRIKTPTAMISLQDELSTIGEYSNRLGGIATVKRALEALDPKVPLTNAYDIWLRLADALGVEAGLEISEKDFVIRTTDVPKVKKTTYNIHLVLDNIRSAFNVGGIFRTADATGVCMIHLCGYTPCPGNAKLEKTALGSTSTVSWKQWETPFEAIEYLKRQEVRVFALETAEPSFDLFEADLSLPLALVAGNEQLGLSHQVLETCDGCLTIPMFGEKNSLNVACAISATLYQVVGNQIKDQNA